MSFDGGIAGLKSYVEKKQEVYKGAEANFWFKDILPGAEKDWIATFDPERESSELAEEMDKDNPDPKKVIKLASKLNWICAVRRDIAAQYRYNPGIIEETPGDPRNKSASYKIAYDTSRYTSLLIKQFKKAVE